MKQVNSFDYALAWVTFISGICISGVAVYYSVAGLMTIFAAAAVPIMIMGVFLESSKLVATIWLKRYWSIAPNTIKIYLTSAVVILMMITSMGIFGYLSKAHSDQAVPASDISAKVEYFDTQINTNKENIESAKKALSQLDRAVDETMARNDSAQGAINSIYIRRSQAKERAALNEQIQTAQANIAKLNTEKAPVASQLRTIEAEVGPIKYIAATLYGDNVDSSILEKSVRAIIILIVIVFDPLAVVLLLASQYSFQYIRDSKKEELEVLKEVVKDAPGFVEPPVSVNAPMEEPKVEVKHETTSVVDEVSTEEVVDIGVHHELKLQDTVETFSKLGPEDTSHESPVLTRDENGWYIGFTDTNQPLAKKKFIQKGRRGKK